MNSTSAMRWVSIVRITLIYNPSQSGSGSFATYIRRCSFQTKRHVGVELRSPREPPICKPTPFPHLLPEIRLSGPLEGFLVRLLHPPEMRSSLPFSIFPPLRRARLLNPKSPSFVPHHLLVNCSGSDYLHKLLYSLFTAAGSAQSSPCLRSLAPGPPGPHSSP